MEKMYRVEVTAITGNHGQTFRKGDTVPHSHLINHDDHLNNKHITEITAEEPKVETAVEDKGNKASKAKINELSTTGQ